jgi:hypothetical protein
VDQPWLGPLCVAFQAQRAAPTHLEVQAILF